jgi:plastocyanin
MPIDRRRLLGALGALGAASLAGCSSGGPGDEGTTAADSTGTPTDEGTDDPGATDTAGGTPTGAQSAFPDYDWDALEGVDPVAADAIAMSGFAFEPPVATMPPGTTVTVTNEDGAGHTVTIPALGVDERIPSGEATSFTVDEAGTFDYVCEFHPPDMLGRLVVDEDAPAPGDATATGTPTDTPSETPTDTATPTDAPTETPTPTASDTPNDEDTPTGTDDGYY